MVAMGFGRKRRGPKPLPAYSRKSDGAPPSQTTRRTSRLRGPGTTPESLTSYTFTPDGPLFPWDRKLEHVPLGIQRSGDLRSACACP
jgi:hypothetical protein